MTSLRFGLAGLALLAGLSTAAARARSAEDVPVDAAVWTPDDTDLKRDLEMMQGHWLRTGRNAEGEITSRQEKMIEGNRETVTNIDGEGKVLRKHAVRFRLEKHGPVRIYSVYELTAYDGDQAVTSAAEFSYVYRVDENLLLDAPGLFAKRRSYQETPVVFKWERAPQPQAQPESNKPR